MEEVDRYQELQMEVEGEKDRQKEIQEKIQRAQAQEIEVRVCASMRLCIHACMRLYMHACTHSFVCLYMLRAFECAFVVVFVCLPYACTCVYVCMPGHQCEVRH